MNLVEQQRADIMTCGQSKLPGLRRTIASISLRALAQHNVCPASRVLGTVPIIISVDGGIVPAVCVSRCALMKFCRGESWLASIIFAKRIRTTRELAGLLHNITRLVVEAFLRYIYSFSEMILDET